MLAKYEEKLGKSIDCEGKQNMAMKHCIIRNLFFNCPDKKETEECKNYEQHGKECLTFPYGSRGGCQKEGKNKAKEEREEDDWRNHFANDELKKEEKNKK